MNGSFLVILLGIPGILVATTVHEFVRALTSTVLGDTYPKSQGQVTLNPVKHFEPIGFLMRFYTYVGYRLRLGQACGNECIIL